MSNKIYGIGDEEELAEDLQEELFELKHNPNIIEIPDNATNGEMIKKIFPNAEYLICEDVVNVTFCDTEANWFDKDWWNAPYKKGENNE